MDLYNCNHNLHPISKVDIKLFDKNATYASQEFEIIFKTTFF